MYENNEDHTDFDSSDNEDEKIQLKKVRDRSESEQSLLSNKV